MSERDAFRFSTDTAEVMKITADGRFYVNGREVETDAEVRDTLAAFARTWNRERLVYVGNLEGAANTALAHLEGRQALPSTREVGMVTRILRTALGARVDEGRGK